MDGSILITIGTLLVLSVCAPASQAPAELVPAPVTAQVTGADALTATFDGSLAPAASVALALAQQADQPSVAVPTVETEADAGTSSPRT